MNRSLLPRPPHFWDRQFDEIRRAGEIACVDCVPDRGGALTVLFVPDARALVQHRELVRQFVNEVHAKHVREELVIAIPLALVVQRRHEEVAAI